MSYSKRFCSPSPEYPQPSATTLERLLASWERLRQLDQEGYRTSQAQPLSTWLVEIEWADARSLRSPGRGTTCSPFTTQSVAMAYSADEHEPLRPRLADGRPLSFLFSRAANGTLRPAFADQMARHGMSMADNEWPRPIILFNLGYAVEPTQLRRGDAVQIDWLSGGGHAVFCWDVHLNARGEVDAFQYVSANGRIHNNGRSDGIGLGVSVGGTPSGDCGFIRRVGSDPAEYEVLKQPLFTDDERYVAEGVWVTWNPRLKLSDLTGCRTRPRGRLCYARTVKAARFHGVKAPPPFAMGQPAAVDGPGPSDVPLSQDDADPHSQGALRVLQRQLALLNSIGWISDAPGAIDGRMGPQTVRAVRSFQAQYQLQIDGVVGPRTREKLRQVYAAACLSPAASEYLATGAVAGPGDSRGAVAFSSALDHDAPRIDDLYFRHATTAAGSEVDLVLLAEHADGVPFSVYLADRDSGVRLSSSASIVCRDGRGRVRLQVPTFDDGRQEHHLVAGLSGQGVETPVSLSVWSRNRTGESPGLRSQRF